MSEFFKKYGILLLLALTIPIVIFSEDNLINIAYKKLFRKNLESSSIIKSSLSLPEMTFKIFDDKEEQGLFSTEKMIGKKYVLNFFASWCGYCMEEYEELKALKGKIPVYGIAWRDSPEKIREMIDVLGNAYEKILLDPFGAQSSILNIQGIPLTLIVNSKGDVVFARAGQISKEELLKEFEQTN